MNDTIIRRYIRQAKRSYTGKLKYRGQFLHELEDALLCFLEEYPEATYSDLTNEFGNPLELKEQFSFLTIFELHKRNVLLRCNIIVMSVLLFVIILYFR